MKIILTLTHGGMFLVMVIIDDVIVITIGVAQQDLQQITTHAVDYTH